MQRLLGPDGDLARSLPGFRERPGQIAMAEAVEGVLAHGGLLLCEAPTGTGKSLAYLVPAALAGKQVVVSTATRALQSQLLEHDVPLVERAVGRPLRAQVLKGRSNYACRLLSDGVEARLADERDQAAFERVRSWLQTTTTGDRAELSFVPPASLWAELSVGPERCRGGRCPRRDDCWCEAARRAAGEADVILVNHALAFADLGLRAASDGRVGVLPSYDAIVFDEAHGLEDVAAEWLGAQLRMADLTRLTRDAERACALDSLTLPRGPLNAVERHGARLFGALDAPRGRRRLRDADLRDLPAESVAGLGRALAETAAALVGGGEEWDLVARQAERLAVALEKCVHADQAEAVVWCERSGPGQAALRQAPIDVAPALRRMLWDEVGSAVLCSATLAIGGDLAFARRRLGLTDARTMVLDSPFDFSEQALLYLPDTAPDPRSPGADEAVAHHLTALLEASGGRALCLFTSHRALARAHELVAGRLPGLTILRQGEAPRERLLERFRREVGSSLFATQGFWQGVDVRGESLSLVAIDRLPFIAPDDPLHEARCERIERDGGSWFEQEALPRAALMLRQGFGRLVRSEVDRGVVALLDGRVRSARYGPALLEALPPARRTGSLTEVREFLRYPSSS